MKAASIGRSRPAKKSGTKGVLKFTKEDDFGKFLECPALNRL
ncbi:hypothetical protein CHCC5022_3110 [Bacillus paralicheniformis]|uniref:Uncharacterized protein n=1 Tax=Bacillus paralicheniformis TaxID=1648923 RepID=A0A7Z0WWX4_9BACI|nr:hypothetical protein B4121_2749 [Bacillus paralicheniformis]TWJ54064.1 hypothetical protein CHCC5022_3110 [Bacillus paralicheniformis]